MVDIRQKLGKSVRGRVFFQRSGLQSLKVNRSLCSRDTLELCIHGMSRLEHRSVCSMYKSAAYGSTSCRLISSEVIDVRLISQS